jgi:hypothetical protein
MSKPPTIASLVRTATKSQKMYVDNVSYILIEDDKDRIVEFFTRLSLPKVWEEEETAEFTSEAITCIHDFRFELDIMAGQTKYIERNIRKLKWHITHAEPENAGSVALLFRAQAKFADFRIKRIIHLLEAQECHGAIDWGTARELLNRAYRDYRQTVELVTGAWLEAVLKMSDDRDAALKELDGFPQMMREATENLDGLRDRVEGVRAGLSVQPLGYDVISPPRYFSGDVLETDAWKHFWGDVGSMSDHLRQQVGLGI